MILFLRFLENLLEFFRVLIYVVVKLILQFLSIDIFVHSSYIFVIVDLLYLFFPLIVNLLVDKGTQLQQLQQTGLPQLNRLLLLLLLLLLLCDTMLERLKIQKTTARLCWLRSTDRQYQSLPELIFFLFGTFLKRIRNLLGIRDFILV